MNGNVGGDGADPETSGSMDAVGFGIAWDPVWIDDRRLLIRGYRARSGYSVLASWDVSALLATIDGALESAGWPEIDRRAAHAAARRLYEPDLAPSE